MRSISMNFQQVRAGLRAGVRGAEIEFTEQLKYVAEEVLYKLAYWSPQWTGNFAANWVLGVNKYDYTSYSTALKTFSPRFDTEERKSTEYNWKAKQLHDEMAINYMKKLNKDAIASIRSYKSKLYYTNNTPYAENVATDVDDSGRSPYLRAFHRVLPHPIPIASAKAELTGGKLGMIAREGRRAMRSKP